MAVAGFMQDRAEARRVALVSSAAEYYPTATGSRIESPKPKLTRLDIGGVNLLLTAAELRTLQEIAGGDIDESNLQDLIYLLPGSLAQKVQDAIVAASGTVDRVVATVEQTIVQTQTKAKKTAAKSADQTTSEETDQTQEPEPTPEPSESPSSSSSDGGDGGRQSDADDVPLPETGVNSS
jgi:hypothetical protein